ncbi:coagulation factor 5/8 type domain-containing protein [Diaporthe amygdali]|uniref:coagulation factor 5/8 type domain-containing protein n=1 Tax=Phomopsis amygdali TaxID=1214568 RepID=UPI0022FE1DD2|nr:coagulation factor 5/8 type domain-containing protein [Diaporthe amygdali]KAJ0125028.1 coagulation factor 5/8 type domain-containing protein [Diaporthe amygdali]
MLWHRLAYTLLSTLLFAASNPVNAASTTAIFLFKDVLQSNTTALKTSGFNTLLIFRIGVLANGDLVYYSTGGAGEAVDAPVITGGEYVGGSALADKVKSFKTGQTLIDRVEISLVSHDATFVNIRNLINGNGTGADTPLYKNFELLRTTWDLDAFNNDDESVYDVSSTVSFAKLLGDIGYKYSIAPYTNTNFWTSVVQQLPGLLDRVYLQVYDGGAGNNPGTWQDALGLKVTPLVWVTNDAKPSQGTTPEQAQAKFANWNAQYSTDGGGYWNDYDIEKMNSSYTAYGQALTSVFTS